MDWNRAAGLLFVLGLHGGVLYGLWSARVIPRPAEVAPLFVSFIAPPAPQPVRTAAPRPKPPAPRTPPKPAPPREPPHRHLAAQAPVLSPHEAVEPVPAPAPQPVPEPAADPVPPVIEAPPAPPPAPSKPVGPLTLASELALACPERTAPAYPRLSRRLGETGLVVLRVELDETGRVVAAQVKRSSGSPRLDAAALTAVRSWRCQPARRDGQPVRAVATQPFNFTLEGP